MRKCQNGKHDADADAGETGVDCGGVCEDCVEEEEDISSHRPYLSGWLSCHSIKFTSMGSLNLNIAKINNLSLDWADQVGITTVGPFNVSVTMPLYKRNGELLDDGSLDTRVSWAANYAGKIMSLRYLEKPERLLKSDAAMIFEFLTLFDIGLILKVGVGEAHQVDKSLPGGKNAVFHDNFFTGYMWNCGLEFGKLIDD